MQNKHKPVLLTEVTDLLSKLKTRHKFSFWDATLGGGGHTVALLKKLLESEISEITALVSDLDPRSWERLLQDLEKNKLELTRNTPTETIISGRAKVTFRLQNFTTAPGEKFDLILADLGLSQNQLTEAQKGFSYKEDSDLDMRLDPETNSVTAALLLNQLPVKALTKLFRDYSQLDFAFELATQVVNNRKKTPITKTTQLNELINQFVRLPNKRAKMQAKVYQALRIAVNTEYENLTFFLAQAKNNLNPNGKLAVITFHSGEEALVRRYSETSESLVFIGSQTPKSPELVANPRSRSAKLFVWIKK